MVQPLKPAVRWIWEMGNAISWLMTRMPELVTEIHEKNAYSAAQLPVNVLKLPTRYPRNRSHGFLHPLLMQIRNIGISDRDWL